ncbi:aromatic hydrocarbon degradation protein [Leptobacterium flavescens]|uniref:Aromatic hydrocarbon degradation protein n=1 Tax=Leptobacterium flavescens TaxID=472055 RepID=A0A6P0UQY9_9FLAO|nr:outer membrane protein transport protein [Leptobacterium flavescens]NER15307.1 aromatic hydrocarbon degradation protein [Leptobacterium flavescens]
MKKILLILAVLATAVETNAQNINDVLRYGLEDIQGTARFRALSGAFGALGGDLSAINVNPAGTAVFNNNYITFSATNYHRNNQTSYFNGFTETDLDNVELNQAGGVLVFKDGNEDSDWRKITLAFNYEIVNNYDDEFLARGTSNQSIDQYFLNFAQGQALGPILIQDGELIEEAYLNIGSDLGFGPQQAFLGFFGGVIDPVDPNDDANTQYVSNATFTNVNQEFLQITSGQNSKFTANFATEYRGRLYLGASLNFYDVNFEKLTLFDEDGYDAGSALEFVNFDNLQRTFGDGFSFDVGAILKVNDVVRIGASYQSPTWYRFQDELSQRINSNLADNEIDFINFSQINVFPTYRIQIPAKATGSIALVFGQEGLLSFDYGYQDFSNAELRPTSDPAFASENNFISSQLKAVSTYRVGGEYKIKQLSLRGGYRFEESPYENENTIGDLTAFSVGLGYNFGPTKIDLAFSQSQRDINQALFDTGLTTQANIDNTNSNVTLSVSFNL